MNVGSERKELVLGLEASFWMSLGSLNILLMPAPGSRPMSPANRTFSVSMTKEARVLLVERTVIELEGVLNRRQATFELSIVCVVLQASLVGLVGAIEIALPV